MLIAHNWLRLMLYFTTHHEKVTEKPSRADLSVTLSVPDWSTETPPGLTFHTFQFRIWIKNHAEA